MNHDAEAGVMVITVKTCKGKAFLIEANSTGEKDKWHPLGKLSLEMVKSLSLTYQIVISSQRNGQGGYRKCP